MQWSLSLFEVLVPPLPATPPAEVEPLLFRFLAEPASLFPYPLGAAAVVVDSLSFRFCFSAGFLPGDEGAAAEVAGA